MAAEPAPLSDAFGLRSAPRLLVSYRRSAAPAALRRNARPDRGLSRMAERGADVRRLDPYCGLLPAHSHQLAACADRLRSSDASRRADRPAPRLVEDLSRLCLSAVRDAAADPDPGLGAVGHHHAPRQRAAGSFPDLPRVLFRNGAQHHAWRQVHRSFAAARGDEPWGLALAGLPARRFSGRAALHLHWLADFDRRRLVFAGRRRDGVGPVRPRLSHQYLLYQRLLPHHRHRHDHARRGRLSFERRRSLRRLLAHGLARSRARFGRRPMNAPFLHARARGAIEISDVVKSFEAGGQSVLAVDHCSLSIPAGEICMIVGPSGCGKTTLLNAIAGFHSIDSGSITLDGRLLCGPGQPRAPIGSDRIVVFQNGALFPWKTNLDNIAFGPIVQNRLAKKDAYEKACALMADAGLSGYERKYPGEPSSGLQRRVEIVRALINEPAVLLLDEPYRALDALSKSVMHEALLETYYRTGVTVFFITHDLEEAIFLGHRVVAMTSRPCRPKMTFAIDIPHPRRYDVLTSPRFRELAAEISAVVDE